MGKKIINKTLYLSSINFFRWSEAECRRKGLDVSAENQRRIAAPAIKLIRFPLLSVDEFANGPAQSGLLDDKDIVSLFLFFIANPKPQTEYIATPRSIMTGSELFVNRFPQLEMRWGYSGTCDRIKYVILCFQMFPIVEQNLL